MPKNSTSKYVWGKQTELQGAINESTIIFGEINTP